MLQLQSNKFKSWLLLLVTILLFGWIPYGTGNTPRSSQCELARIYFESQSLYKEFIEQNKYDSAILYAKKCLEIYDGNIAEYKTLVTSFIEIGQYDSASKYLEAADILYPFLFPHSEIGNLKNFINFNESPSFLEIKNGINTRYAENSAKLNKAYILELKKIYELDQKYRSGEFENSISWTEIAKIDKANFRCLRKLIKKHGFPQLSNVGPLGTTSGFLVLQHSFEHHKINYLDSITYYNDRGLYKKDLAALFVDRQRMELGLNQLYGSQIYSTDITNNNPVLWPLEDTSNVDYLRLTSNLNDLNSYTSSFGIAKLNISCGK